MIHVDPPFDLGETLQGTLNEDRVTLINEHWEGAIFSFPDVDRTPSVRGNKARRSGIPIRAICVRNTFDVQLTVANALGGFCVEFDHSKAGRKVLSSVTALTNGEDDFAGVGDPELGTTKVEKNDLFWVIIGGVVPVIGGAATTAGGSLVAAASGKVLNADAANVRPIGIGLDACSGDDAAVLVAVTVPL